MAKRIWKWIVRMIKEFNSARFDMGGIQLRDFSHLILTRRVVNQAALESPESWAQRITTAQNAGIITGDHVVTRSTINSIVAIMTTRDVVPAGDIVVFAASEDQVCALLPQYDIVTVFAKDYVVASDKARAEAMAAMDFQSMRSAMQELKGKLDADLAEILSEEQLAAWKTGTTQRGRGGPPGGFQRGPGQSRPGNN